MKSPTYVVKKTVKNNGKPKITNLIEAIVDDAFDGIKVIRTLDDLYGSVSCVVSDMIMYLSDERPDVGIVNFKVVANENNNVNDIKPPFVMDIFYKHKDSTLPTQLHYVVEDPKPTEIVDKFAPWKK